MSQSLFSLRHAAKEMLAAAVVEVFPGTQMIEGEVDEIGFSYTFLFSKKTMISFGENELVRIEDHLARILFEKREIVAIEMMRENAANFFRHLKQHERAQKILQSPYNTVTLLKMGQFHDLSPKPFPSNSSLIGVIKLLRFEGHQEKITIYGTAFDSKQDLKEFLKKYKVAKNTIADVIGPKENYFLHKDSSRIYLPKGEALLHHLKTYWRSELEKRNTQFISTFIEEEDPFKVHHFLFEKKEMKGIQAYASMQLKGREGVSIFCNREDLLKELISSLHFIEQTIKIFQLESRIYIVNPKKEKGEKLSFLIEALHQKGLSFVEQEKPLFPKGALLDRLQIEFRMLDCLGREWNGPFVIVDEEKNRIEYSLFGNLEKWIDCLIEQQHRSRQD